MGHLLKIARLNGMLTQVGGCWGPAGSESSLVEHLGGQEASLPMTSGEAS